MVAALLVVHILAVPFVNKPVLLHDPPSLIPGRSPGDLLGLPLIKGILAFVIS
jgi:hypothetical protein